MTVWPAEEQQNFSINDMGLSGTAVETAQAMGQTCRHFTCMHACMQAALVGLFSAEGFRCEGVAVQARRIQNRLRQLDMDRRWIQAVFTYTGAAPALEAPWVDYAGAGRPVLLLSFLGCRDLIKCKQRGCFTHTAAQRVSVLCEGCWVRREPRACQWGCEWSCGHSTASGSRCSCSRARAPAA